MKAAPAFVGALAVDSYPFSIGGSLAQAKRLAATGVRCMIGYLGSINKERLGHVLAAGLAFMPVTKAMEYRDGAIDEIAQLQDLGIPKGVTVWLDLEGLDVWNRAKTPAERQKDLALMRQWATAVKAGGWMPGLYVGAPQPFTSEELYLLPFERYWWGLGMPVDDKGAIVYPRKDGRIRGWCMEQHWHGNQDEKLPAPWGAKGGMYWPPVEVDPSCPQVERVFVDTNSIHRDNQNALPVWAVAA